MRLATIVLFVLSAVSLSLGSFAQGTPPPSTGAAVQSAPAASNTPTTAYTLPPDKLEKSKALYDLRGRLRIIGTIWSFVVVLGILYLGVGARYRNWAEKTSKWTFVQAFIVVAFVLLTFSVLDLPLDAYRHSINLRYGLSVQGWGSWFSDVLKGELLSIVIATPAIWFLFNRIRKSPRWWWLHTWLVALPFIVFLTVIAPIVIEPMFFKFEPLEKSNPQLVEAIEKVTARGGLNIPPDRMFLMKASEKVTELNAYVTGFGPSKRVVVWDTTIQKATTPETLFVFGHEMGHYVLNHIYYGLISGAIGLLIALYLLSRVSPWFLRRFGERWQIRELGDWASLPMIFLIFGIMGFLATPLDSAISRRMEHNADVYGLEVTHGLNPNSQEAGAHAFQVLGELSLDYPHPNKWLVLWYYDHPSIPDRVRFAHEYDPWSKGEQPRYVK